METSNPLSDVISALQRLERLMDNEARVMTFGEAAYTLKKSDRTIKRYIAAGKLHKVSGNGVTGVPAREVYRLIWK